MRPQWKHTPPDPPGDPGLVLVEASGFATRLRSACLSGEFTLDGGGEPRWQERLLVLGTSQTFEICPLGRAEPAPRPRSHFQKSPGSRLSGSASAGKRGSGAGAVVVPEPIGTRFPMGLWARTVTQLLRTEPGSDPVSQNPDDQSKSHEDATRCFCFVLHEFDSSLNSCVKTADLL